MKSKPEEIVESPATGYQGNAFGGYLHQITDLLINHGLKESSENDKVRKLALAQTMIVLWDLSPAQKGALIRFLYEAGLVEENNPLLPLKGANLSSADLNCTNLNEEDARSLMAALENLDRTRVAPSDQLHSEPETERAIEQFVTQFKRTPPVLRKINLDEANLRQARLEYADLSNALLRRANLHEANLQGITLLRSNLQGATLSRSNLSKANLEKADFSQADIREANIQDANLTEAVLIDCRLAKVDGRQSSLKRADLRGADLKRANLAKAFLYNSNLRGADLRGASLREANLSAADVTDAKLDGADLGKVYLSAAKITSAQLEKALTVEGAQMPDNQRMQVKLVSDSGESDAQVYYYQVVSSKPGSSLTSEPSESRKLSD